MWNLIFWHLLTHKGSANVFLATLVRLMKWNWILPIWNCVSTQDMAQILSQNLSHSGMFNEIKFNLPNVKFWINIKIGSKHDTWNNLSATLACSIWPFHAQPHLVPLIQQGDTIINRNFIPKKYQRANIWSSPCNPHWIITRLCSFPSPPYFNKPCDIFETDRPFCYTRLKEA